MAKMDPSVPVLEAEGIEVSPLDPPKEVSKESMFGLRTPISGGLCVSWKLVEFHSQESLPPTLIWTPSIVDPVSHEFEENETLTFHSSDNSLDNASILNGTDALIDINGVASMNPISSESLNGTSRIGTVQIMKPPEVAMTIEINNSGDQQRRIKLRSVKQSGQWKTKCSQCEMEFTLPYEVKRHERVHDGPELYYCDKCGIPYKCRTTLSKHLKRAHDELFGGRYIRKFKKRI